MTTSNTLSTLSRDELARGLFKASHLRGDFLLRSGVRSTEYFDKYRFESDPKLLRAIAQQLVALIPSGTELLAGLELGGVPIAAALALETGIPAVYVRKAAKPYGTCKLAEGAEIKGRRLLIVEDIVTSGGQAAISAKDLRDEGALISHAICVINRSGRDNPLADHQLVLKALFTKDELSQFES